LRADGTPAQEDDMARDDMARDDMARADMARADAPADGVVRIDCDDCAHRDSHVCDDCLVTFLCEREPDGAVVIPLEEVRSVRMLQDAGLAPRVRHRRRVG
jgi:hypothetical protein